MKSWDKCLSDVVYFLMVSIDLIKYKLEKTGFFCLAPKMLFMRKDSTFPCNHLIRTEHAGIVSLYYNPRQRG